MLLRERFRAWRRERPFWGALLIVVAGLEMFLSGRLNLAVGGMVLQLGLAGLQTTIIPLVVVLAGVLVALQPHHRIFYGVIVLALSVYAVVAVNAGGLVVGTLLGVVGGIMTVSWMGPRPADDGTGPVATAPIATAPLAGLDAEASRTARGHRSAAAALSVALVMSPLATALPADGPCWLGFLFCDLPSASPSPSASASPSASPSSSSSTTPAPSPSSSSSSSTTPGSDLNDSGKPAPEPSSDSGLTVPVPQQPALPSASDIPLGLAEPEDVSVYAVPAELKASDLEIKGIRSASIVSVPVKGRSGERRNAIKLVVDHIVVSGFQLKTYAGADNRSAGTYTSASSVSMDGSAIMYITSLTAAGPDGSSIGINADTPPKSLTAAILALVNPTIGLLGATSDAQVWSGFHESVWHA